MKRIFTALYTATLCFVSVASFSQTSDTIKYTGSVNKFVVPNCGASSVTITAFGAQGSKGGGPTCRNFTSASAGGTGGLGGQAMGTLAVTAGDTLYVYVGGQSGWNGGGDTGTGYGLEGGFGGGASDVRFGGTALTNRVIVAGGGGGGGAGGSNSECSPGTPGHGGDGGAGGSSSAGDTGSEVCTGSCPTQGLGGQVGTISAGGTGGTGGSGSVGAGLVGGNGTLGLGGVAGGTSYNSPPYWSDATGIGGGGGGGYYGGGGGGGAGFAGGCGAPGGGGGGGSSYTGGVTGGSTIAGVNSGNGYVVISYSCTTGINELIALDEQVKVYPNPFTGVVNISVMINDPISVTMFNMLGENMGTWQITKGLNTINTQFIPAGVYTLQVKAKSGVINKKLTKLN